MMYMDFDKVSDKLVKVEFNIAAAQDHMVEAEREIITIKGRGRGIFNMFPYSCPTNKITTHLIYFIILCLNVLMYVNGIFMKYSPRGNHFV